MRTKCHTCLCRTCLNTCCDRKNCTEKKEICENYKGFRQLSIFEPQLQPQYQSAPRHSLSYYGISKAREKQLTEYIQSGRYASLASQAAHRANKENDYGRTVHEQERTLKSNLENNQQH